uniref:Uncharacterized protein n=1 Tax=Panagrolaimus sp. ES5 TaxID=591445 RepID=A0AC34GXV7_9BILA
MLKFVKRNKKHNSTSDIVTAVENSPMPTGEPITNVGRDDTSIKEMSAKNDPRFRNVAGDAVSSASRRSAFQNVRKRLTSFFSSRDEREPRSVSPSFRVRQKSMDDSLLHRIRAPRSLDIGAPKIISSTVAGLMSPDREVDIKMLDLEDPKSVSILKSSNYHVPEPVQDPAYDDPDLKGPVKK